jgi:uncharacterized protein with HEPN domain
MYDESLIIDELRNIEESLLHILDRSSSIKTVDDFGATPSGVDILDIVTIRLMSVGEEIKKIDNRTEGKLLSKYNNINWKGLIGMRDFIAHAYFRIDAKVIFNTIKNNVKPLLFTIQQMISDLEKK